MGGQARRDLVQYAISVNEKGRVVVDMPRKFAPPQWENPASYLAVDQPVPR